MRRRNPALGRFDSCAAPLSQKWLSCVDSADSAADPGVARESARIGSRPPQCGAHWRTTGARRDGATESWRRRARLGHSSITITLDRYGHLFPSVEEALAEKLDAAFNSTAPVDAKSDVIPLVQAAE